MEEARAREIDCFQSGTRSLRTSARALAHNLLNGYAANTYNLYFTPVFFFLFSHFIITNNKYDEWAKREHFLLFSLSLSIDNCYMQRLLFHAILEEAKTEFDRIARARKKRKRNDAFSLDKRVFAFNRIVEKVTFGQWSIFWSTTRRKKNARD